MARRTILIIDDVEFNRRAAEGVLRDEYDLIQAGSLRRHWQYLKVLSRILSCWIS